MHWFLAPFGIAAPEVAATFLLTATFGTAISPSVAAVYVGPGLSGVTISEHIRYSLLPMWCGSILTLFLATLLRVITFKIGMENVEFNEFYVMIIRAYYKAARETK